MNQPGTYRYQPLKFFGWTVALSWACWIVSAVLAVEKERQGVAFLFSALALFVPTIVVLFITFGSGNATLKADFKDRLLNLRRISPRHLLVTVLAPPLLMAAALGISLLFGQPADQFQLSAPMNQLAGLIILGTVIAPIIEELGWRGYGMDSLRAGLGTLRAAIVFGVLWSAWHAPLVFIKGTYHYELAHMDSVVPIINFFVSVVVVSVYVSWLYYKHNRSILAGILAHSMLNAAAMLPAATQETKLISSVLFLVVAVVLIVRDRELWAAGPRNYLGDR